MGSGLEINFLWYRFGRASLIERRSSGIILIAGNMLKFVSKLATISAIISHVASVWLRYPTGNLEIQVQILAESHF